MTIRDDIAAIRADSNRTERQRTLDIYQYKIDKLRDVILNGKPAPNPIPPLINRTFTLDGKNIRVNACSIVNKAAIDGAIVPHIYIDVNLWIAPSVPTKDNAIQILCPNPPPIPRSESGNEKQDLIQAASEWLALYPVT